MSPYFREQLGIQSAEMNQEEARAYGMVQVGWASPGSPAGDIYASETLLAQVGHAQVAEMVRDTYRAAYDRQREARRAAFDAKVRSIGYVDRVTGRRIYDPDQIG